MEGDSDMKAEVTSSEDKTTNDSIADAETNNKEDDMFNSDCGDNEANRELLKKKATQLLLLGKRNILIHDFQSAVGELGTSCQLFKLIYEEQAEEMGDPYFYYGKALFELARSESEVLGEPAQEDKDDDDDDECDEEEEEKDEKDEKGGEDENKDEKKEENSTKTDGNDLDNGSKDCKEGEPGKENENGPGVENEPVNDLQLSWECLELAKLIYQRNADKCKDTAIKLAEVYLLLGENGLESENYQTAVDDMKQALALQQRVLPEEDRRIAETFYHLGVAHSLNTKFDEAVVYFKSAIAQLEKKIASLEARKKAGDKTTEEEEKDAFYTMDGEIENIRSIIKDIEDKISDMNDYKNEIKAEAVKKLMSGGNEPGTSTANNSGSTNTNSSSSSTTTTTTSSSSSVPVTDISHLVRKKRKNESEEENCAKKQKQEDNNVV